MKYLVTGRLPDEAEDTLYECACDGVADAVARFSDWLRHERGQPDAVVHVSYVIRINGTPVIEVLHEPRDIRKRKK